MILVDSAVWIDHLHRTDPRLVDLLGLDQAGCHPLVIQELALGSIRQRDLVLDLLTNLHQFPVVSHHEIVHSIRRQRLWGRGLSAVDVHLMAAVTVEPGAQLWTRDERLTTACAQTGVKLFEGG